MLDNCFRFAPRDSIPGLIAKICKYLKDHPGWSEAELENQIKQFIGQNGVDSFNGRNGAVVLNEDDVNNLKIASAYFAEGNETIDKLDLVSLYNQGVRFVFTDFNSVTSGYNLAFVLDYFDASGEVVYYPVSTGSGGGGNIVSVNGKTGEVHLKVVDVSSGNSPDENAYIFIDESDDYPDVISSDSSKLGGQLPSYYASAEDVSTLKDDIVDLKNKRIKETISYKYSESLVPYGYQTTIGEIKNDPNWYTSNYIKTSDGDTIEFVLQAHPLVGSICLYDENKVFISNITADYNGTGEQSNFSGKVEINSENKGYFRYTFYKKDNQFNVLQFVNLIHYDNYIDDLKAGITNNENAIKKLAITTESKFLAGKTIFLAGDSRSSTDYSWTKTIMEEKTGATVLNEGWSGATIAQFASDEYYVRVTKNPHDYCIILIGANDTGASGSIGTFASDTPNALLGESLVTETDINADYSGDTFVQALSHFIRKWKRDYGNWRSKANLTGSETEEEKEIKLDAVKKPVLLLCTDIPQQRVQSGYPWDNPTNQLRKNNAIKECAEKYDVHLIDLFTLCNFDMSIEPFWTSPTDKVHNNGVYYMDGLHLNKYGQDLVTSIQIEALKRYSKIY